MMTDIVLVENRELAIAAYTEDKIEEMINKVREAVASHEPDLSTAKGRAEIASLAHKVSKYKVRLDGFGKELVSEWKQKSSKVDAARRKARTELDELRDKVREPLTKWEEEEEARLKAEQEQRELEEAHVAALESDQLWEQQRELERREAEVARREEEARLAREKAEREERERQEAAEHAAREKARREKEAAEAKERAAREEKERVEREVREAREREEREARIREEARQKALREAVEIRRQEEALKEADRKEQERKASLKRHRAKIKKEVVNSLVAMGLASPLAEDIFANIDAGLIDHVSVNYF